MGHMCLRGHARLKERGIAIAQVGTDGAAIPAWMQQLGEKV